MGHIPALHVLLLLSFALCVSCGNAEPTEKSQSHFYSIDAASEKTVKDLFTDTIDFNIDDVRAGATNCSDITEHANPNAIILPWPSELKTFLLGILRDFPNEPLLTSAVHGIYLVDGTALQDPKTSTTAAGLACDRGSDHKGLIFLNNNSSVNKRKRGPLGQWQATKSSIGPYLTISEGDAAAVTLMHEVFHAIDNKIYANGTDFARKQRAAFLSHSWNGNTPKFARSSILSLQSAQDDGNEWRGCRHNQKAAASNAQLREIEVSAFSIAEELRRLKDDTNFIVPYTMTSPSEDIAETLTVYYFGTKYNSWQRRTVSNGDNSIFLHDTQQILNTKQQHKSKTCAAVEMFLGPCAL